MVYIKGEKTSLQKLKRMKNDHNEVRKSKKQAEEYFKETNQKTQKILKA